MNRRKLGAAALAASLLAMLPARAQSAPGSIAAVKARGKLLAGVKLDTPPFGSWTTTTSQLVSTSTSCAPSPRISGFPSSSRR